MSPTLGAVLALVAALLFAAAAVAQQSAASALPDARGRALLAVLLRRPLWWVGTLGDTLGFAAQAAALAFGALVLVQPLLVTTLLFALPLGARWAGRRVRRDEVGWAAVLAVALGVFVAVGAPAAGVDRAPFGAWVPALAVLAVVVAGCLLGSARTRGPARAVLLAVVVAVAYGLAAALTTGVVSVLDAGAFAVLRAWETWGLAVSAVGGTWLQQVAFASGGLGASLPTVTVGEPLVGSVLGVVVLGEGLAPGGPGRDAVLVAVLALTVLAVVVLARSSARARSAPVAGAAATTGAGSLDSTGPAPPPGT